MITPPFPIRYCIQDHLSVAIRNSKLLRFEKDITTHEASCSRKVKLAYLIVLQRLKATILATITTRSKAKRKGIGISSELVSS